MEKRERNRESVCGLTCETCLAPMLLPPMLPLFTLALMLVLILIFVVETVVVPVPSCSNCICFLLQSQQ